MPIDPAEEGHSSNPRAWFTTTHWSVVLMARDEQSPQAAEALEKLCRHYWRPIYAFIRRRGNRPDDARDLTQAFFARLLEKHYLDMADATKGKFRTLLLTTVNRFLVNEWERTQTQKRGGGAVHLSLDADVAEDGYRVDPADPATPDTIYERRWAETLLETVLARLRQEFEDDNQQERFELLKPYLAMEKHAAFRCGYGGAARLVRIGSVFGGAPLAATLRRTLAGRDRSHGGCSARN